MKARTAQQIGNHIRNARKKRGWSQAQLGEKAGMKQATVSVIETGSPKARLDTILAALAALDLEFLIQDRTKSSISDIEDIF